MIAIEGRHNRAIVFADTVEQTAREQIRTLCDQSFAKGSKIRIMPDVHAGAGCTIGTTMTIGGAIVPNLVGVDIGCGVEVVRFEETAADFSRLDALIRREIPSGFAIRKTPPAAADDVKLASLRCAASVDIDRARHSVGTLGGGNHFIEVARDEAGLFYLLVHSGSRHLGLEVANFYQKMAQKKRRKEDVPPALAYLTEGDFKDYLHDMAIIQRFADTNRRAIARTILEGMNWRAAERFATVHNYIDTDSMILRKGAVSARRGERLLIPMNMRDGSLICVGKGNIEWNHSAPHGAGRLMSRSEALKSLSLPEFKKSMGAVYTTSVGPKTLDEAPMAYKPMHEIARQIGETVDVETRLVPVYNFKAAEK